MIIELISIIVGVVFMTLMCQGDGSLAENLIAYLDLPSLICILIFSLPILARNGLWKDFLRAFKMLRKKFECSLSDIKRSLDAVEFMQKHTDVAIRWKREQRLLYLQDKEQLCRKYL